jgi:protein gp37
MSRQRQEDIVGEHSKIEWTDHTFNPWIGCQKISAGCDHCYAERMGKRLGVEWGPDGDRRLTKTWRDPVRWHNRAQKQRASEGFRRPRVFCGSLCDVFEADLGLDVWRARLWELVEQTTNLCWLLLTKRPQNILGNVPEPWHEQWPGHVWVGTTVETQLQADQRLPHLCSIRAPGRFVSCEPLLGPVDLTTVRFAPPIHVNVLDGSGFRRRGIQDTPLDVCFEKVDWVIAGGESGPKARPMHPDWARGLREACRRFSTPFFFKQWGEWAPGANWEDVPDEDTPRDTGSMLLFSDPLGREHGTATEMRRVGKKQAGHMLDGDTHTETPGGPQ